MTTFSCRSTSLTDVGRRREHNEDAYLVDGDLGLFLVADGMGGHACGEVASTLTAEVVHEHVRRNRSVLDAFAEGEVEEARVQDLLREALLRACAAVFDKAQREPEKRGMGTTCTALVIAGDHAFVAHVGDSRAYLTRSARAVQLTRDHSVLNELVDLGELTAAEAEGNVYAQFRNTLARAVGVTPEVEVDTLVFEALPGDTVVLGSDGLFHYVPPGELAEAGEEDLESLASQFVARANERGGHDNITVVLVRVEGPAEDESGIHRADEFERKFHAFAALDLFENLSYRALIRVLSIARARTFPAGTRVFEQGDEGDALYVVLDGGVRLDRGGHVIDNLTTGAHFGEQSLIDQAPRSATARTLGDTRLLVLRREDFVRLVRREPEIAVKVLWNVAQVFAQRLRTTTGRWEEATTELSRAEQDTADLDPPDGGGPASASPPG